MLTAIALGLGLKLRAGGDMAELPSTVPIFLLPDVPLNLNTLLIILPYSATMSAVGLLESMMTATIVDDMTHTSSDKNRECVRQGIANLFTGFLGGMAGCAIGPGSYPALRTYAPRPERLSLARMTWMMQGRTTW